MTCHDAHAVPPTFATGLLFDIRATGRCQIIIHDARAARCNTIRSTVKFNT